ncbi:MAG: GerMN domain-containing protein, partial [Patescibacteria group bacterium]
KYEEMCKMISSTNKKTNTSPTPSPTFASPGITKSPTQSPSPTTAISPTATPTTTVKIFLIAKDDNGASGKLVGCGDSAVAVEREVPETKAVLRAAIEQLISIKDKSYGESGLYNALADSSLNFQSAEITDGKATIKLTGPLNLVGTCEDARIQAQLKETALQFSTVQSAEIFINDKNLDDILSQAGP